MRTITAPRPSANGSLPCTKLGVNRKKQIGIAAPNRNNQNRPQVVEPSRILVSPYQSELTIGAAGMPVTSHFSSHSPSAENPDGDRGELGATGGSPTR